MRLNDAQKLAQELMRKHKLTDWKFQFDEATRRFGYANYTKKVISLSRQLVALNNDERVKNTILYEIAHALTPGAKHTWMWKLTAQAIGCDGNPRYDEGPVKLPPTKVKFQWEAVCETHHFRVLRKKYRYGLACKKCCDEFNHGKYDLKYKFRWERIEDLSQRG